MKTELEFTRECVGSRNWVVARRTPRIVGRYGEDVVCLSPQKYSKIVRDYAAYQEAETIQQIANDTGAPLEALRLAYRAGKAEW